MLGKRGQQVRPDQPGGAEDQPIQGEQNTRRCTQIHDRLPKEEVQGELVLHDSPWDPLASKLPMREQLSAHLWWPTFLDRQITLAGPLDPQGFLPFVDVISGSRWPGVNGGPER